MAPTKSPISIRATSGRPKAACTARSEVEPVAAATCFEAGGTSDVDAAMNAVDPGRAAERHDHAGRAENGEATHDAETRIERLFRDRLTPGNRDRDDRVGAGPALGGKFGDRLGDHRPRHRIDRRLAHRQREPGPGDRADPLAGTKQDAGTGAARSTRARTRQPWVTSGSSPASLTIPAVAQPSCRAASATGRVASPPRGNARSPPPAPPRRAGGPSDLGCRGRTGAGRPAPAQPLGHARASPLFLA